MKNMEVTYGIVEEKHLKNFVQEFAGFHTGRRMERSMSEEALEKAKTERRSFLKKGEYM